MDPSVGAMGDEDINASMQPAIWAITIIFWLLASVAVALRFFARRLACNPLGLDDWLALAALALQTGCLAIYVLMLVSGLGKHFEVVPISDLVTVAKVSVASQILYVATLAFAKYSILALYWRIFGNTTKIRVPIGILTMVTTGWFVSTILASVLACRPLKAEWDFMVTNATCDNEFAWLLAVLAINLATDLVIVTLPIPYVMGLQQRPLYKVLVCGIFLLAGFVCVISIIRLVVLLQTDVTSPDATWDLAKVLLWGYVESGTAIVSACLPSLRPIVVSLSKYRKQKLASSGTTNVGSSRSVTLASNFTERPVHSPSGISLSNPVLADYMHLADKPGFSTRRGTIEFDQKV